MSNPELLTDRAAIFGPRPSVIDARGTLSYRDLLARARGIAQTLLADQTDLAEARVAYLLEPGADHVAAQWGIWLAGGIAVPLAASHPSRELEYVLDDSGTSRLVTSPALAARVASMAARRGISVVMPGGRFEPDAGPLPTIDGRRRAMMVYTSGTTGKPKGVITTHANISAQISTLVEAWAWTPLDRSLHLLPLHHIHGIINALCSALWIGATVEFLEGFEPIQVWERLASGEITLFTAVPTIYSRLIAAHDGADQPTRERWSAGARSLRLMMSGSAALPVGILERWEAITGQRLLERYGMTEIGMALANPLRGERRAGTVGQPLPGVHARLVDDAGEEAATGAAGQIEIQSPQVFLEYWGRPEETRAAFRGGWFRTGDVAQIDRGYWRILGRQSVDIIKSAGYKISALEIEEALREHPNITDCAVVGRPDPDLGERIVAAVVCSAPIDPEQVRGWLKDRLAPYKIPKALLSVTELPRNAMGKVTKPSVKELFD